MDEDRDLVEVLKFELEFLNKGGYGRSPRTVETDVHLRRLSLMHELRLQSKSGCPCSDCVLMQLIPPELRFGKNPCRHIALNVEGETLDSIYRYEDQHEIKRSRMWLLTTIAQLEKEREAHQPAEPSHLDKTTESHVVKEPPLCQNLHPKCADPACPTAFSLARRRQVISLPAPTRFLSAFAETLPKGSPIGLRGMHLVLGSANAARIISLLYKMRYLESC